MGHGIKGGRTQPGKRARNRFMNQTDSVPDTFPVSMQLDIDAIAELARDLLGK